MGAPRTNWTGWTPHEKRPHPVVAYARSLERDRRRFYSPGVVVLFLLVMVFGTASVWGIQHQQQTTRSNSLSGCLRSNAVSAALLDLGKIITSARAQTSTSQKTRRAALDFLAQVKRLDPRAPATKALQDLAILLGGDSGQPADARELAAAEDDFIAKAKQLEKPRDCRKLYG